MPTLRAITARRGTPLYAIGRQPNQAGCAARTLVPAYVRDPRVTCGCRAASSAGRRCSVSNIGHVFDFRGVDGTRAPVAGGIDDTRANLLANSATASRKSL